MNNEGTFYINVANFRNHITDLKQAYNKYNTNYEQFLSICSKMDEKWNDNLTAAFIGMISKEQEYVKTFYESFIKHCDSDLEFCEGLKTSFNRYGISNLQTLEFSHEKMRNVINIMETSVHYGIRSVLNDLNPMTDRSNYTDRYEKRWYSRARSSSAIGYIDSAKNTFDRIDDEMTTITERYRGINDSIEELIETTYGIVSRIEPNLIKDNQMLLKSTTMSAMEKSVEKKKVNAFGAKDATTKIEDGKIKREWQNAMGKQDSSVDIEAIDAKRQEVSDMVDNVTISEIGIKGGQREVINHFGDVDTSVKVEMDDVERHRQDAYSVEENNANMNIDGGQRQVIADYITDDNKENINIGSSQRQTINDMIADVKAQRIAINNGDTMTDENSFRINKDTSTINTNTEIAKPTVSEFDYSNNQADITLQSIDAPAPVSEFTTSDNSPNVSVGSINVTKVSSDNSADLKKDIEIAISNTYKE